jgi:anti-sigma regulatory factor (Ser/Thr protein kinase)
MYHLMANGALIAELGAGTQAAAMARELLAERFGRRLSKDALTDATLVISELINNSVEHGGAAAGDVVHVTVQLDDGVLHAEVRDHGPGFAPPQSLTFDDLGATSGRGLRIVDALAERWGVQNGDGSRVWFEIAATRSH